MKLLFTFIIIFLITPSMFAQSNFAAGINLSVDIPTEDFNKFYKTGYGGDAHFLYHLGNQAILSFTVGYNIWGIDEGEFNKKATEADLTWQFDLDSDFRILPILLGAKWLLSQNKKGSLYVGFMGGIYNYKFSFKATANRTGYDINRIEIPEINKSGTETMLALGLGYFIRLGKHWYTDLKGYYNIVTNAFSINDPVNPDDPQAIYGVKGTLQYVSLLVGLNYRF